MAWPHFCFTMYWRDDLVPLGTGISQLKFDRRAHHSLIHIWSNKPKTKWNTILHHPLKGNSLPGNSYLQVPPTFCHVPNFAEGLFTSSASASPQCVCVCVYIITVKRLGKGLNETCKGVVVVNLLINKWEFLSLMGSRYSNFLSL